ncbi:NDR1/HIN1-like protein [Drosera capensis]
MNGHDHTTSHSHHNHRDHQQDPYYASSSSSPSLKGCCCFLFLLLSLLLLLLLAVTLAILLSLKPTEPRFDLQQVSVSSVTVTTPTTTTTPSLTAAATLLSLSMRMQFLAANPNKVGIRYGESRFTVMYRGVPLGEGRVAGFYQAARSVREVETVVGVERVGVQEGDAAELVRDAEVNDRVELRVLGDVGARVRVLGVDTPAVESHEAVFDIQAVWLQWRPIGL